MPGAVPALLSCVALSVGLHAALLWPWAQPIEDYKGNALRSTSSSVLQARLAKTSEEAQQSFARSDSAVPSAPRPEPLAVPRATRAVERKPVLKPPAALAQRQPSSPSGNTSAAAEQAAPAQPGGTLEGYVPKAQLSEPPVLQTPVIIGEPSSPQAPVLGIRTGILALYIDEAGRVQAAVGQEPRLPEAYEQAAREAFLSARYKPGKLDGRPVRSRIRVEVQIDGGSTAPP